MKKLRLIGNIIFFSLVVHFVLQSVNVFMGKKDMQLSLSQTNQQIKELKERKSKLEQEKENAGVNNKDKNEKFARNNLNLKRKGEVIYKIVD
ncbi:septum formation initiator family protein [Leptotrichia sp. oral taxon 879]|uniref:Septum formation initiator family protein n=1 Tax=Leptotrichia mesophila TaxID=3239303 RepID=A0AB39V8H1_9FUSO|nr:septum formation initiator family protein [Leptotrichia sp. oral taxon 879]ERK48435.1 septum formation initiator [Leptotrichia sp. oral taxon 879 str. F0557]